MLEIVGFVAVMYLAYKYIEAEQDRKDPDD